MAQTKDFVPYLNVLSDKYLESGVIARMYQTNDYYSFEYYGVVSHKFYQKIKKSSDYVKRTIENDTDKPDVYSFFAKNPKVNLVLQGNNWHPLFSDIYNIIANRLGWSIDFNDKSLKMEGIYSNHWIASVDTYEEYCYEFLLPVIDLMENNKVLRDLCNQDANYISRTKLSPERCLKVFNRPYYTYHCFILERLFPIFCYLRDKTVKHI